MIEAGLHREFEFIDLIPISDDRATQGCSPYAGARHRGRRPLRPCRSIRHAPTATIPPLRTTKANAVAYTQGVRDLDSASSIRLVEHRVDRARTWVDGRSASLSPAQNG